MELKALIILGICVGCFAVDDAVDGSGDESLVLDFEATRSDDSEATPLDDIVDGSGEFADNDGRSNVKCNSLNLDCWCVYLDGTQVPGSRKYALPMDCSKYSGMMPTTGSTTRPSTARSTAKTMLAALPSRPRNVIEATAEVPVDDITYVDGPEKAGQSEESIDEDNVNAIQYKVDIPVKEKEGEEDSETVSERPDKKNKEALLNTVKKPEDTVKTEKEPSTNKSGAPAKSAATRHKSVEREMVPPPGILAALIGGGVVLLLCAVLIILFIIYRVRKKDEGSYPLGDEKPIKNYAYSKAPSKEFFA